MVCIGQIKPILMVYLVCVYVSMGGRGHRAGGKGGALSGGRGQGHRGQMSLITLWSGRE